MKKNTVNIGHSIIKAESWFDEIQENQGKKHVRLGILIIENNNVIGDVALQDIDWKNRSCSVGSGIAKKEHRNMGYGSEAVNIIMEYGFNNLGLERISAKRKEFNKLQKKRGINHG